MPRTNNARWDKNTVPDPPFFLNCALIIVPDGTPTSIHGIDTVTVLLEFPNLDVDKLTATPLTKT